jgi:hypothetical protein
VIRSCLDAFLKGLSKLIRNAAKKRRSLTRDSIVKLWNEESQYEGDERTEITCSRLRVDNLLCCSCQKHVFAFESNAGKECRGLKVKVMADV